LEFAQLVGMEVLQSPMFQNEVLISFSLLPNPYKNPPRGRTFVPQTSQSVPNSGRIKGEMEGC